MDWEEDLSHTGLPRIEPESPPMTVRLLIRLSHGPARPTICFTAGQRVLADESCRRWVWYVYVRHVQMWLQHVGEKRVLQIGTFPALFLISNVTFTFRRNSLLRDSCM
jgi:hypothetical protein